MTTTLINPDEPNPYAVEVALAAALQKISDQQDAQITQAWAQAWGSVSADLLDTLSVILADVGRVNTAAVVRYQRLSSVLASIADHLDGLTQALGVTITSDLHDVVQRAELGTRELITAQKLLHDHERTLPLRRVPSPAMQAIVSRTTQQVTSQLQPLADDTYTLILRELTKGTAAGDNPRTTARRMVLRAEDLHNFGRSRAVNIARTETLDAYRAGAETTQKQYADVLAGWAWVAHLGARTCRSCLAMNGQIFDLDVPGPDDHQQGRCSRVPVVREADGSVDTSWLPDAEKHFEGLPEADQRAILGNRGYAAWKRGDFPIDQWTKVRHSEGWRDAQVPASPQDSDRGSVGAASGSGGSGSSGGSGGSRTGQPTAPAGEPRSMSDAITIIDEEARPPIDAATTAIDQVHQVPATMAGIEARMMSPYVQTIVPGALGLYRHMPVLTPTLELRPPGDTVQKQYVTIHELGHAVDDLVFGDGQASETNGTRTVLDGELAGWWGAVQDSRAYLTLSDMDAWDKDGKGPWATSAPPGGEETEWNINRTFLDYLLRPTELFARSYAQWVIDAAGTPSQRFALDLDRAKVPHGFRVFPTDRTPNYPVQWLPDDFEAIAAQLQALFEGRGLIPRG